jgi:hypothetical protein
MGKCLVRSAEGFAFFDLEAEFSLPYFMITRNTDFLMKKDRSVILCDQTGTFTVDPEARSYTLYDGSKGRELSVTGNWVNLPVEEQLSLHGHTFPVTAGSWLGNVCATGDLSGSLHIWSPWTDRVGE